MQLARTALKERIEHLNRLILCSKSSGVNSARSSMADGHISALSIRTSMQPVLNARLSSSSSINPSTPGSDQDEDSTGGEFNDGNASLSTQVRALQADLGDRNRYIVTLEKRLLQARRSSQSRTSYGLTGSSHNTKLSGLNAVVTEGRFELLLKEKDDEIAELRTRLDDKERMVSALRSAARKRDAADVCASGKRFSGESAEGVGAEKLPSPVEAPDGMVECF